MYMSTRKLNALLLLLGLSLPAMAQSVDYSVVAVGEESGLDFKKITSDNDCLCMPEVKRRGKKITWWSGRVIAMSPTEEKLAFLSYKTNNSNIYLKNLTGAGTTQQRTNRQQIFLIRLTDKKSVSPKRMVPPIAFSSQTQTKDMVADR